MIDLHCDTLSVLYENKNQKSKKNDLGVDLFKLKKSGSVAEFFACFVNMAKFKGAKVHEEGFLYALKLIEFAKDEFEKEDFEISLALCYKDYLKNKKSKKISAFLTVEEGGIIGNDISKLEKLYKEGVRLLTICWNYENSIGFPNSKNREIMQKGLKKLGFEVVEKMNDIGMIIDISHLSDGGFFDVISYSKKPVIASHSCARSLCNHPRNLTDEMIKLLAEKCGICGVNFYPFFLHENGDANVESLVEHIKYMINVGGEDFVALGSDFDGFSPPLKDLENIAKTEVLFEKLKRNGISERQLEKLKITNAERIIKEIL